MRLLAGRLNATMRQIPANSTPRPLAGEVGARRRVRVLVARRQVCAAPRPSPASLRSTTSPARRERYVERVAVVIDQYTRAFGGNDDTSLVIVCSFTGR